MSRKLIHACAYRSPGAGKTTITEKAVSLLIDSASNVDVLHEDLDVCVPQWMRENFGRGVYPTLNERTEFMKTACQHVGNSVANKKETIRDGRKLAVIVSFSFVNIDLREGFRKHFPDATWILIDSDEVLASERIAAREGHFYKNAEKNAEKSRSGGDVSSEENSEWEFKQVSFDHVALDGRDTIESNAKKIVRQVRSSGHEGRSLRLGSRVNSRRETNQVTHTCMLVINCLKTNLHYL